MQQAGAKSTRSFDKTNGTQLLVDASGDGF